MSRDRRTSARLYARKRRERELAKKLPGAARCPHQLGRHVCGGPLTTHIGEFGQTVITCEWCERRKRGVCQYCPARVYGTIGRTKYCAVHRKLMCRELNRAFTARHHKEVLARARASYQDPEVRRRRNEYKRLYRIAHPDKVRAQKRRYVLRKRKRYMEYHRRYNSTFSRQQKKRDQARRAYYEQHRERPSPKCQHCGDPIPWQPLPGGRAGAPPKNCDRCCTKAELKRRLAHRAAIAEAAALPPVVATPVQPLHKPIRVKKPQPHRYAPSGERLCLTPGCDIVVAHRKKICGKCRRRRVEEAQQLIAITHGGRGRRTDLERRRAA